MRRFVALFFLISSIFFVPISSAQPCSISITNVHQLLPYQDTFIIDVTLAFSNRPSIGDIYLKVDTTTYSTGVAGMSSSGFQFLSLPVAVSPNQIQLEAGFSADPACVAFYSFWGPAPIPTLSQWGLFLLGLMVVILGIVGVYKLQRTPVINTPGEQ